MPDRAAATHTGRVVDVAAIRRADIGDLDRVNRLFDLAGFARRAAPEDLTDPYLHVLIDPDGLACGAVYISRDVGRWTAHATSLAVDPAARGRGLAKAIVAGWEQTVVEFGAVNGPMRMFGYTNPGREATRHILASRGWTQLSTSIGDGSSLWAFDT